MGFLEVMKHSTTVLEELEWQNLKVAQWNHQSSIETLRKHCLSDESDRFNVISLCSSSSKLFVSLFLVLVLVPSIVSKKPTQPDGIR